MMNLKTVTLFGLLGVTQQAPAPLPNASNTDSKFPLYPTPESSIPIGQQTTYNVDSMGGY